MTSKALWVMLILLSPLVGFSFIQAVSLYAEASRSAQECPDLATGMVPLDGILVPTFGGFYIAMTLLFPFVAIRVIGMEKYTGAIKLLLQTPFGIPKIIAIKLMALLVCWFLTLVPGLSAVVIWQAFGGHLYWPDLLNLLLGQMLYSLVIAGIAFFAASITDNYGTAAIVALSFTIGSWVLDFSLGHKLLFWSGLGSLSLTAALKGFEQGLFALSRALQLLVLSLGFVTLSAVWFHPGRSVYTKTINSMMVLSLAAISFVMAGDARMFKDTTEDRRHSFSPAVEKSLQRIDQDFRITVHLAPDDPRLVDLDRSLISKLQRLIPRVSVVIVEPKRGGLFGAASDDAYGQVFYEYAGRKEQSRSTNPKEVLPLIFGLARLPVPEEQDWNFAGHPLVVDAYPSGIWFYCVLPLLFASALWFTHRW
jgi:hypothetical protein